MAMVCPQCSGSFEQQIACPTCGVRLVYDAHARRDEGHWQQTPWGRILIGLLLALGLSYGLELLARATLQVADDASSSLWTSIPGILLLHLLQGFSLLIGGTITGAGQKRGLLYGSFVGLVNGLIFLFFQLGRSDALNEIGLYTQPVLHLAFGAAGGLIGTLIWRPLPVLNFRPLTDVSNRLPEATSRPGLFSGPISWVRVLAGVAFIAIGVVWSQRILAFVLEASDGRFVIATHFQGRLVTWEICAIMVLVGAGIAGAGTFNGLKHGLLAGLGAAIVIMGVHLGNPRSTLDIPAFMVATFVVLALTGGWFGSQLFPPIAAVPRRRRIGMI